MPNASTNKKKMLEQVRKIFTDYLEAKKQRKTPERYAILEEIYSQDGHFDVETLYIQMKNRNYHVSRATVYNTLDLLLECSLVTKHQFGQNMALFEKSHGYKQHDHLICNVCNHVMEFCDPRIQQIQNMMGELLKFNVTAHSLNLYGSPILDENNRCASCKKEVKLTVIEEK
ncbi:MAG: transcriptional repressor [Bacteroidota bacterium]|nr:transcriptional repressor [Bacteroidota bacterium]MDX5431838.1 transcriptional repressor [Bacteroidota bacterium]MDX5470549.1 transcriptional repressor [Bacteroidota bacterium]